MSEEVKSFHRDCERIEKMYEEWRKVQQEPPGRTLRRLNLRFGLSE